MSFIISVQRYSCLKLSTLSTFICPAIYTVYKTCLKWSSVSRLFPAIPATVHVVCCKIDCLKVTVFLRRSFASKCCSVSVLNHRYLNSYIRLNPNIRLKLAINLCQYFLFLKPRRVSVVSHSIAVKSSKMFSKLDKNFAEKKIFWIKKITDTLWCLTCLGS